jgi:parvulin-like peptidyl-prolyl isomerase
MDVASAAMRLPRVLQLLAACPSLLSGCAALTSPPEHEVEPQPVAAATPSAARPAPIPTPAPMPKEEERAQASHILIAYKGARNAPTTITRSKEQAKKRAENVLKKALKGGDFAALAKEYSDDPGSGPRGGDLGTFTRTTMVKPFADGAFGLRPGELSTVVETDFGFHVIRRTQ